MTESNTIDVTAYPVVVFSSNYCGYCQAAKRLLHSKGVDWKEYQVDGQPETRQFMVDLVKKTSVPQIWIGGEHVGGCDELYALDSAGELDQKLSKL